MLSDSSSDSEGELDDSDDEEAAKKPLVSSEGQSDAVVEGQPVEVDDEAMEDETKEGEDEKPTAPLVIKKKKEKKPEKKDSCYMWCCKSVCCCCLGCRGICAYCPW